MIPFGTNVVAQDLLDQLKIFAFGLYSFVEVISGIDILTFPPKTEPLQT